MERSKPSALRELYHNLSTPWSHFIDYCLIDY
jgi:hypothetical protein